MRGTRASNVSGCSTSSPGALVNDWLNGVVSGPTRRREADDVLLGDRDHLQIALLQAALERSARSERGDLHAGDIVLGANVYELALERFFAIAEMVELHVQVNVDQAGESQERGDHDPTRERGRVDR